MAPRRICYRTPQGVTSVWEVDDPHVANTDADCAAYLAYWHPDYIYLGREGAPVPSTTTTGSNNRAARPTTETGPAQEDGRG